MFLPLQISIFRPLVMVLGGNERDRGKGKKGIMERERKKGLDREREIGKGKEVRGKRERDRRHGEGGRKQGRG